MGKLTTGMSGTRCQALNQARQPCRGFANESGYCIAHDPARRALLAEGRSRGGLARQNRRIGPIGVAEKVELRTLEDVLGVLEVTLNDLRQLENSISRARAIVSLCDAWANCYANSELESRVSLLEQGL